MQVEDVKHIIYKNRQDIAFIIGNGINKYSNNNNLVSWDDLLIQLWDKISHKTLSKIPKGISLTEFYDVIDIENVERINIQKEIKYLLTNWNPIHHHSLIIEHIKKLNTPLLTTNFDENLSKAGKLKIYKIKKKGFTDYYPWKTYYGNEQMEFPINEFGIWHINGMIKYHRIESLYNEPRY